MGDREKRGNTKCSYCRKTVKNADQGMHCGGFCETWSRIDCVNIGNDEYEKIQELGKKVSWICTNCETYLNNVECLFNMQYTNPCNINKIILSIQKSIKSMPTNTEEVQKQLESGTLEIKIGISYADITKFSTKQSRETQISNEKVLFIKPKKQQDLRATNKDVKENVNPTLSGALIRYYRETKDGLIVIKSYTKNNLEKLYNPENQKLTNKYELK